MCVILEWSLIVLKTEDDFHYDGRNITKRKEISMWITTKEE